MAGTQASIPRARSVSRRAARVPGSRGNRWPLAPPRTPACGARIARAPGSVACAVDAASPTSTRTATGSPNRSSSITCVAWRSRRPGSDVWICPDPMGHLQATGHRRGRPQAVSLPPAMAGAPRSSEVRSACCGSESSFRGSAGAWSSVLAGDEPDPAARARRRRAAARRRRVPGRQRGVRASEDGGLGLATLHQEHVDRARRLDRVRLPGQGRHPAPSGDRRSAVLRADPVALATPRRRCLNCWPTSEGRRVA